MCVFRMGEIGDEKGRLVICMQYIDHIFSGFGSLGYLIMTVEGQVAAFNQDILGAHRF